MEIRKITPKKTSLKCGVCGGNYDTKDIMSVVFAAYLLANVLTDTRQ